MDEKEVEARKEELLQEMYHCNNKCNVHLKEYNNYADRFNALAKEYKRLDTLHRQPKFRLVVSNDD